MTVKDCLTVAVDDIKSMIAAYNIVDEVAADLRQNERSTDMHEIAEELESHADALARLVYRAGYHTTLDAQGDLIASHICLCAAHSANECGCGAWDVPVPGVMQ